jgi:hypothetical protein
MLSRPATNEEIKKVGRLLQKGEEAWVYSTVLEFLGGEFGVCIIRNGVVTYSRPIFGVQ